MFVSNFHIIHCGQLGTIDQWITSDGREGTEHNASTIGENLLTPKCSMNLVWVKSGTGSDSVSLWWSV